MINRWLVWYLESLNWLTNVQDLDVAVALWKYGIMKDLHGFSLIECLPIFINTVSADIFFSLGRMIRMVLLQTSFILSNQLW